MAAKVCQREDVLGGIQSMNPALPSVMLGRIEDMVVCREDVDVILERHKNHKFFIDLNRWQLKTSHLARPSLLLAFK